MNTNQKLRILLAQKKLIKLQKLKKYYIALLWVALLLLALYGSPSPTQKPLLKIDLKDYIIPPPKPKIND
tara:strand:- start:142 stop:351 length:210 start_codon:yes stop_codon:yes gene_type:complete